MRVVVVGATGNVGTSTVRALVEDPAVEAVVGLARCVPAARVDGVEWRQADVRSSDLASHFRGADAVVHLAWLIQPSRDLDTTHAVNVDGSARVFEAVAAAGVPAVVYASSVAPYSAGPKDRLAVTREVRGAFNIAADPVLDPQELGRLLEARPVPVPAGLLRGAADVSWRLHLQPTPAGWVDMALGVPLMDTTRAREELGWRATHSSGEALLELLGGMRDSAGEDTPPLEPRAGGPLRLRELFTGV